MKTYNKLFAAFILVLVMFGGLLPHLISAKSDVAVLLGLTAFYVSGMLLIKLVKENK
jgi:hypothetical protein